MLSYSGELKRTQGKSEPALARLNEALDIHRELGNTRLQASTLKYQGEVFWRMSRHREAVGQRAHTADLGALLGGTRLARAG